MRIDAHVHMMGKECRREKFLENLKEAGMDGAVVFLHHQAICSAETGITGNVLKGLLNLQKEKRC